MDLAKTLLRTMARAFYQTEHILIIDALCLHSTLTDADLAHVLNMQTKALRRYCGKLKEDGMISSYSRAEKKENAPPMYGSQTANGQPKERVYYREWYYLNFHHAIDSIKYRLYRLSKHIESQGAPTTERKDLICPRCKSTYTELEVIDNIGDEGFYCHRCSHLLDTQEETDGPAENESMKRMNDQLGKIVALMQQIDSSKVPENDFETAFSYHLPIQRPDTHQGPKFEAVEDRKAHLASSKGLAIAPEKISVSVGDETTETAEEAALRKERRDKEAKQNMLPEWISRSTINGAITAVGAKEDAQQQERNRHLGERDLDVDDGPKKEIVDDQVMDDYWKMLKAEQERERQEAAEEEEEDDDDDEFEDVDVGGSQMSASATNGKVAAIATPSTGLQSSNATDDEGDRRDVKKVKIEEPPPAETSTNGAESKAAESDEDEGMEFEDV